MKKNVKGFTLVELLAVLAIMAILSLVAIPNVVNMLDKGKKEKMVTDAKELVSKAKYKFKVDDPELQFLDYSFEFGGQTYDRFISYTYYIDALGYSGRTDGYGDQYSNSSFVIISLIGNKYYYGIYLTTDKHYLDGSVHVDNVNLALEEDIVTDNVKTIKNH